MYFGIFHGSTYGGGTTNFIVKVHSSYPRKPIYDTEFGYWSSEDGSNEDKQIVVFNDTFDAFRFFTARDQTGKLKSTGYVAAVTWWCAFDWYTHQQGSGFQSMGLITMDRSREKPVAATLRAAYEPYYRTSEDAMIGVEDDDNPAADMNFGLDQNYPNPFNSTTVIKYSLNKGSYVSLKIYDLLGREVAILANDVQNAGTHSVRFEGHINGRELPSGMYFYRLKTDNGVLVKKMMLIK
jgi:beta-glucuronidase